MQAIDRWRNWKPSGENFCDSVRHELTKPTKAASVSFVSALPGQTKKIRHIDDTPPDETDAWRESFHQWLKEHCVFRDRCFGGLGSLHLSFAEFCAAGSEVAPCMRATFERLLTDADFLLADGMVYGLIFKADLEAAIAPRVSTVRAHPAQRNGQAA